MRPIDHTHDSAAGSWVPDAQDSDFPLQNLPWCSFSVGGDRRLGVGIGSQVLDVRAVAAAGLFDETLRPALMQPTLNAVMALPASDRIAIRHRLFELLSEGCQEIQDKPELAGDALLSQSAVTFELPCEIGDYSDFYASVFHATNVGSMFRPDNPLLPNYKHIPIGYHGRASSIVPSATPVRRPCGQHAPVMEGGKPRFGPAKLLDYELEVGVLVSGGNPLGERIPIEQSEDAMFGLCLVNDWSARDLQKWEYQPLGPFLAKSFATTVSPWVVTLEALAPFRCPAFERDSADPQPLAYLTSEENQSLGGFDVTLEVQLSSETMRQAGADPVRLSSGTFRNMYWTLGQMVTHHSSNGCNLRPGDLLASGTVSGPERGSRGCLLELTWDGEYGKPVPGSQRTPLVLPTGEERRFLADGDEVALSGFCEAAGYNRIGFGDCRGTILPAIKP